MKVVLNDYYRCDICNKKIESFDGKNVFKYHEGWHDDDHSGFTNEEGHVCDKCKRSKLRRFIAYNIFKRIGK